MSDSIPNGRAFVAYRNDDNKKKEAMVDLMRVKESWVVFRTNDKNVIHLPTHRILKIKQRDIRGMRL